MNDISLLDEIFAQMKDQGFVEGTEQYEICRKSLSFLGFSYKRSEELDVGVTVDCSTLTSQSHWEGALIGIPFVADNQRQAMSGVTITSPEYLIPGDVIVKYPSLDVSPDRTWNHVGLYLGNDNDGVQWLIESTSKTGVRLAKVDEFNPQGGIKRFSLTDGVFTSDMAKLSISLAPLVPKFGRLGVRQYLKSGNGRSSHKGIDIYISPGTGVLATLDGEVHIFQDEIEDATGVEITNSRFIARYYPLDVSIEEGSFVRSGDLIGTVIEPSGNSLLRYSLVDGQQSHLHLEIEVSGDEQFPTEVTIDGRRYANHLYLSKIGRLSLPFHL